MVELTHMQQLELEKAGLEDRLHRQHSTYVDYDTTNQGRLDALELDLEFFGFGGYIITRLDNQLVFHWCKNVTSPQKRRVRKNIHNLSANFDT